LNELKENAVNTWFKIRKRMQDMKEESIKYRNSKKCQLEILEMKSLIGQIRMQYKASSVDWIK
jgi:hypothetical protein